ncbi:Uncharacterised protein [Nocardia africana]|uniref:Uncharacterized protein n=1 Tax=Nocardia africana TaxID=134964 RepID=A0A378X281_9NOCA|nr:Uncharacterised protein [Nocardia africana]
MDLGRYEKGRLPNGRAEAITGQAATTTGEGPGGPRREIAPRSGIVPRRSAAYRTPERGSSRAGRGENVDSRVHTSPAIARYNRSAAAMSSAHSIVAATWAASMIHPPPQPLISDGCEGRGGSVDANAVWPSNWPRASIPNNRNRPRPAEEPTAAPTKPLTSNTSISAAEFGESPSIPCAAKATIPHATPAKAPRIRLSGHFTAKTSRPPGPMKTTTCRQYGRATSSATFTTIGPNQAERKHYNREEGKTRNPSRLDGMRFQPVRRNVDSNMKAAVSRFVGFFRYVLNIPLVDQVLPECATNLPEIGSVGG